MVGRAEELERLRAMVHPGGNPRVALVSGEAGVGKTRLIQELVSQVPAHVPVLTGQAEQGAMGRPYQLLLEAVSSVVAGWTRVPPELRPWEDALATLLAPVAVQLSDPQCRCSGDELARAATELVRFLVGDGPGLVVFEDLHWADAESLGLFRYLAASPQLPILLVGTFRPEDLDRRHVTDLLSAIERQHQVEHLALGRLSVEEVRALVTAVRGGAAPYATAADLHRRTRGNPFFLEELLLAAGSAGLDQLAGLPLPATLTEAVLRHLDGLEGDQRLVVDTASILGQRIPFDMLAALTGLGEDRLVDVLRALVGQSLIVEEDTDVFSFRHALTREAVAGRLLGRERRRLHEKALAALQESGSDDWAALAYHAEGANRWDDVVVAARAGAAHYLRTGATYQALRLAEMGLAEMDADLELLELATRAAWSVGLPDSALERAEQWRRLATTLGDTEALSHSLRVLARLRWEAGDVAGHRCMVAAASEIAERLPPGEERAWVANLMAESAMLTGHNQRAVEWADEAARLAGLDVGGAATAVEGGASAAVRAAIWVNKGSALTGLGGREDEAEALLLAGLDGAERAQDFQSALRAINNLAHMVFRLWPVERASQLLDRMGQLIERSGREDWRASWHVLRATYYAHVLGDLRAAQAELTDLVSPLSKRSWAAIVAAELAMESGDAATATRFLWDPEMVVDPDGNEEERVVIYALRARLAGLVGDEIQLRELLDDLARALRNYEGHHESGSGDLWYHALMTAARAGLSGAEVEALLARSQSPEGGSRGARHPVDPAWSDHLRGALAEMQGQFEEAASAYTAAAVTGSPVRRSPSVLADAHLGAARSLRALDRVDEARAHAEAARSLLARWPGPRHDETEALLHRLGEGRGHTSGVADLTARELEVVSLAAQGLTNGQIAARLFISTKTASVHVSNALRKLDLRSRVQLAEWAAVHGPGGATSSTSKPSPSSR
jgi:DNA-binding CsgD family transcriptional regulator/tetratricopeptide (TPR) repeat protein